MDQPPPQNFSPKSTHELHVVVTNNEPKVKCGVEQKYWTRLGVATILFCCCFIPFFIGGILYAIELDKGRVPVDAVLSNVTEGTFTTCVTHRDSVLFD